MKIDAVLNVLTSVLRFAEMIWKLANAFVRPRTSLGKAIQAAERQKKSVEALAMELEMLHIKGRLASDSHSKAREAYAKWAKAQIALADSLATWRTVLNEASCR